MLVYCVIQLTGGIMDMNATKDHTKRTFILGIGVAAIFLFAGILQTAEAAVIGANPDRTRFRPEFEVSETKAKRLKFDIAISNTVNTRHDGVEYYNIQYGKNEDLPSPKVLLVDGDETQVNMLRLKTGTKYYFEVTAYFNDGKFSKTIEQEAWTKPNRPRFLKIRRKTHRSARLKWAKPYRSPWYTRHEVRWYKVNPGKKGVERFSLVGEEYLYQANVYFHDISNLESDTQYAFQLRARIFSKEWGKWSDKKFFRTKKAPVE